MSPIVDGALREFELRRAEDEALGAAADGGRKGARLAAHASSRGSGDRPEPPAPARPERGTWGFGRSAIAFMAGLGIAQVGVQAWAATWPKWVQASHGQAEYTLLASVALVASLAASYVGGWTADRLGLRCSYAAGTALVAAGAAAILILSQSVGLPFAGLVALAAFATFVLTAAGTAEQTIPIALFQGDPRALQRYNSVSQFLLQAVGVAVPYSIGVALSTLGPIWTLSLLPLTGIASLLILAAFVRVPEYRPAELAPEPASAAKTDPRLLRLALFAYPAFMALNILLYNILAIGYGNFLHPGASLLEQAAAAGAAGRIVGFYSLGGLLAALHLSGVLRPLWARLRAVPGSPRDEAAVAEGDGSLPTASRWTALAALGLAGFIPFAWTSGWLASLGMIPFGFTNVMGTLLWLSLIQGNAPPQRRGQVMGGVRTAVVAVGAAGVLGFGQLLRFFPASPAPFWVLLGVLAVLGGFYAWLARRVRRLGVPGSSPRPP